MNWQSILGLERLRESARYWLDEGGIAVADRLELAQLEWKTQSAAIIGVLLAAALALFFFFGVAILGSLGILLSAWQTEHWTTALFWVLGVWTLGLVAMLIAVFVFVKRMAHPFILTRRVLTEDWQELKERL